jgi:hypothetical protein
MVTGNRNPKLHLDTPHKKGLIVHTNSLRQYTDVRKC